MKLETLYKRTKTGAIQYWQIAIVNGIGYSHIIKESGQLGTTSPVIHKEHVGEGKQKRNIYQQAEAQAQSDWKKKHDEGYKTAADQGYEENTDFTLEQWLQATLKMFNTDASGNAKPMLATDWKKVKNIQYPCMIQPKLDGVRCLMIVEPDQFGNAVGQVVKFLSRSGKEYTSLDHIAESIISAIVNNRVTEPFILDGEVYSDKLSFQDIVSSVKAFKPNSLKLKFRAYDVITDDVQHVRWNKTVEIVDAIGSSEIQLVSTFMCASAAVAKEEHDIWVAEGYEGAMLRMLGGMYASGQRSRELLKVKEFDETEFKFLTFEKGQRDEDLVAVCQSSPNEEFKAKMIGTVEQKEKLWAKGAVLSGKLITVKHFGYTESGLPRFPIGKVFRNYE